MLKMTFIAGCVASLSTPVFATNWDMSNEYAITSLHGQAVEHFAKAVKEKTNGSLTITTHHGSSLGFKSVDHFDAVGDGALQSASTSFVFLSGIDPAFQLGSLPFIASDMDETRKLYDIARPLYEQIFQNADQEMLLAITWPVSGIWANKPILTPDDIKALKIRSYDVGSTETLRTAGAFPVQLSWSDVTSQLSTNAIDAVLTSANGGAGSQFWDLQSNFTNVNYTAGLQAIHVNMADFEALTPEEQAAVREAAAETEAFGWKLAEESLQADYAKLREHGVTITESISPEFAVFLKESGQPYVDKWLQTASPELKAVYEQYRAETN